jgi:hypothetical protein
MQRDVIIVSGFTDKPEYVEVFCMYVEGRNDHELQ